MSKLEAKLGEAQEILNFQMKQSKSELKETVEDNGTDNNDLNIVGLKRKIVNLEEEIRTIEVCIVAYISFRYGSLRALERQTIIIAS